MCQLKICVIMRDLHIIEIVLYRLLGSTWVQRLVSFLRILGNIGSVKKFKDRIIRNNDNLKKFKYNNAQNIDKQIEEVRASPCISSEAPTCFLCSVDIEESLPMDNHLLCASWEYSSTLMDLCALGLMRISLGTSTTFFLDKIHTLMVLVRANSIRTKWNTRKNWRSLVGFVLEEQNGLP